MSRWDVDETRDLVQRLYGRTQLDLLRPSLRSVIDRQQYARFHYHEAQTLLDRFVLTRLTDASLLEVVYGGDKEAANEFQDFITKIGAHSAACVQSLHAIADIMGHALYYALALNLAPKPLAPRAINASSVLNGLQGNAELGQVHRLFERLCTGGTFAHLAALVNYSKHRSIILPSLSEDWTGLAPKRHTIKLSGFLYEGVAYPEASIKDFIVPEYDRCSILVVDIGNASNAVLRARI